MAVASGLPQHLRAAHSRTFSATSAREQPEDLKLGGGHRTHAAAPQVKNRFKLPCTLYIRLASSSLWDPSALGAGAVAAAPPAPASRSTASPGAAAAGPVPLYSTCPCSLAPGGTTCPAAAEVSLPTMHPACSGGQPGSWCQLV